MDRLEFHISYFCKNACVFCSEKMSLEEPSSRFVPLIAIKNELERYRKREFVHVTFTGGEPSWHPDMASILRFAKSLGFKTFVTSNGGRFASKRFCGTTLPFIDEISFSVHGPDARVHNTLTKNQKSFGLLVKALRNIERSREKISAFANIVLLPQNLDLAKKTVKFISRFRKVGQVLFSNLAPEGAARDAYKHLALPLEAIEKRVPGLIQSAESRGLTARFFGVPLCVLKGYEGYSNDLHWSPRATLELACGHGPGRFKETISFKPVRNRIKPKLCLACSWRGSCGGIFKLYLKTFPGHGFPKPS